MHHLSPELPLGLGRYKYRLLDSQTSAQSPVFLQLLAQAARTAQCSLVWSGLVLSGLMHARTPSLCAAIHRTTNRLCVEFPNQLSSAIAILMACGLVVLGPSVAASGSRCNTCLHLQVKVDRRSPGWWVQVHWFRDAT
ncbi:hypothetical protein HDV57DRAFT_486365 [Trichoderma longibrachiatum]